MSIPTMFDILEAKKRLEGITRLTPLINSDILSEHSGYPVYVKCENLQRTGAFKIRGAYNTISQLSKEDLQAGVVAASSGNHAIAVSYVARMLGIRACVVLPSNTAPAKQAACRALGAELVFVGIASEERLAKANELAKQEGLSLVHPFDDYRVICGNATIGLEIMDQLPEVEQVVVQIGGGALLAGISQGLRLSGFKGRIVGVEPAIGSRMTQAFAKGYPVDAENWQPSIADGLRTKKAGELTYPIVRQNVDEIVTLSEDEILQALNILVNECKLFVEPSSAVTVAAALSGKLEKGLKTVCLLSGGNTNIQTLAELLAPFVVD